MEKVSSRPGHETITAPESTASAEKAVRKQVLAQFDRATMRSFYKVSPARSIWTFTHIWIGIMASIALGTWAWESAAWWPKAMIPLLVFYIGTRHNAIGVQIHEASHTLLFPSRFWNDFFCNFFGAYWVLNDVDSYRRVHLVHHTDLHLESDPDLDLYMIPPNTGRYPILKLILQDLCGITALRRIVSYTQVKGKSAAAAPEMKALHLVAKLACQMFLLILAVVSFGWLQGPAFYVVFWCIPLFSVFPAIVRLRIVTEHFSPDLYSNRGRPFISRSTISLPLEIYLFGCDMEYHFEHHLLPTIPQPQLARMHHALVDEGFFQSLPSSSHYLSGGYLRFWWKLLTGKIHPSPLKGH